VLLQHLVLRPHGQPRVALALLPAASVCPPYARAPPLLLLVLLPLRRPLRAHILGPFLPLRPRPRLQPVLQDLGAGVLLRGLKPVPTLAQRGLRAGGRLEAGHELAGPRRAVVGGGAAAAAGAACCSWWCCSCCPAAPQAAHARLEGVLQPRHDVLVLLLLLLLQHLAAPAPLLRCPQLPARINGGDQLPRLPIPALARSCCCCCGRRRSTRLALEPEGERRRIVAHPACRP